MASTQRATAWSVTINNPNEGDEEQIALARQKGWKVDGQREKGENGTVHYQLIVKTPQVRFSQVKKQFTRAHIEIARNVTALEQYVHKEETKDGELNAQNEFYPSLAKFYKLLVNVLYDTDKDYRLSFNTTEWYRQSVETQEQRLLDALDHGTMDLIRMGYHVESIAVNPQTRSAWKRFGTAIIFRTQREMDADRQTDRQTELMSQEIHIPTNAAEGVSDTEGDGSSTPSEGDEADFQEQGSDSSSTTDEEGSSGGYSDTEGSEDSGSQDGD